AKPNEQNHRNSAKLVPSAKWQAWHRIFAATAVMCSMLLLPIFFRFYAWVFGPVPDIVGIAATACFLLFATIAFFWISQFWRATCPACHSRRAQFVFGDHGKEFLECRECGYSAPTGWVKP